MFMMCDISAAVQDYFFPEDEGRISTIQADAIETGDCIIW
jgi:hypothetical protein